MKTKIRKYGIVVSLATCLVLCTVFGTAFMKEPSEAKAEEIKTYSSSGDVTETIEADLFAEDVTYESDEGVYFEYVAGYGGFSVTGCSDECTDFYIPDTLTISVSGEDYTYPVVYIVEKCASGKDGVTYIRVGRYVEYVGRAAFYYRTYCTAIDYFAQNAENGANGSTTASNCPFGYASYKAHHLDLFIGASVEVIPAGMFAQMVFSTITFEEVSQLKEIGASAFCNTVNYGDAIPEIRIPDTVETIGAFAFNGFTKEVGAFYIPESLTSVGKWAFGLYDVDAVYFNAVNFPDVDTDLAPFYNLSYYQYIDSASSSRVAFTGATVYIGKNVRRIPDYCFCGNTKSCSVYVEKVALASKDDGGYALESIGDHAFCKCEYLSSVTLPMGLETIESHAFDSCSKLTSVTLGDTDGWYVTDEDGTPAPDTVQVLFGSTYMSDSAKVAEYLASTYVEYCYHYTDGFTYELSEDGTYYVITGYVGDGGEVTLTEKHRGKYVNEIGESAFKGITTVTSVVIPERVTTIDSEAFYGCTSLASVTIRGSGLEEVGSDAFYNCSALKSLYVSSASAFVSVDYENRYANPLAVVSSNKGKLYVGGDSYTTLSINDTDRIGTYAFAYCTIISDIVIGEKVAYIGNNAFDGMSDINTLTFSNYSGWSVYAPGSFSATKLVATVLQGNEITYLTSTYVEYTWEWAYVSTVAPTISSSVENNGYTNTGFDVYVAVDSSSSIYCLYFIDPTGTVNYVYYAASVSFRATATDGSYTLTEGTYEFYAVDMEGNLSDSYFITFDDVAPELYLGDDVWANYNSSGFSVFAYDELDPDVKLWCSLDGEDGSWFLCDSNPFKISTDTTYATDGEYWFAAVDAAGNFVGPYYTVLDTMPVSGSWEHDDDMFYYFRYEAPSYSKWTCTVNGASYVSGTLFTTDRIYYYISLTGANGTSYEHTEYLDHYFSKDGEYHEATCTEQAYTTYTCIYCGEEYNDYDLYSSSGDHTYKLELVEPTCTESGYSQYVCTGCGATTGYQYIPATGHQWTAADVSIEPSCTANGFLGQVCEVCEAYSEYGTVLPATGHDWVNDDKFYTAPTCTEKGCSRSVCTKCGVCGDVTYTAALGHILVTESKSSTCAEYGYSKTYCTREGCEYFVISDEDTILATHVWSSEPAGQKSATCEESGYIIYVCEVCGAEDTVYLNPTGHTWVYSGETTIEGSDGEETAAFLYECSKCGATKVEAYTDAKEAGNAVTELFEKYQKYIWWILLALVVVWSLFIGLRWALQRNDQERVKTRSMLANYVLGLFVIAVIVVGLPYLVYGIAILVG